MCVCVSVIVAYIKGGDEERKRNKERNRKGGIDSKCTQLRNEKGPSRNVTGENELLSS